MYVYGLFKTNDKPTFKDLFYVGITNDLLNRMRQHNDKSRKKKNLIKDNMIKKYGFNLRLLSIVETRKEAEEREIFLIDYFGRRDKKTGQLANHTDGGEGVNNLSEETKDKISDQQSRFNKIQKLKFIDEFKKSGLSKSKFCKINSITTYELSNWIRKFEPSLISKQKSYTENQRKEIIKDYQDSNLTIGEYSKQKNISEEAIVRWRARYGLSKRIRPKFDRTKEEDLVKEYEKSDLNHKQFAASHDLSRDTIDRLVRKYNIKKGSKKYSQQDRIDLYTKFKESNLSFNKFCQVNNLKYGTFQDCFRKIKKQKANNE